MKWVKLKIQPPSPSEVLNSMELLEHNYRFKTEVLKDCNTEIQSSVFNNYLQREYSDIKPHLSFTSKSKNDSLRSSLVTLPKIVPKVIEPNTLFKEGDLVTFFCETVAENSVSTIARVEKIISNKHSSVILIAQKDPFIENSQYFRHNGGVSMVVENFSLKKWTGNEREIMNYSSQVGAVNEPCENVNINVDSDEELDLLFNQIMEDEKLFSSTKLPIPKIETTSNHSQISNNNLNASPNNNSNHKLDNETEKKLKRKSSDNNSISPLKKRKISIEYSVDQFLKSLDTLDSYVHYNLLDKIVIDEFSDLLSNGGIVIAIGIIFIDASSNFFNPKSLPSDTSPDFKDFIIFFYLPKENIYYYLPVIHSEVIDTSIINLLETIFLQIFKHNSVYCHDGKLVIRNLLKLCPKLNSIQPNYLVDSKIASWIVDSKSEFDYSFKYLCSQYIEEELDFDIQFEQINSILESFLQFLFVTFQLCNSILKKMENLEFKYLLDIESPLVYLLAKLENHGIRTDFSQLKQLIFDIKNYLSILEKIAIQFANDDSFNLSSPKQVSDLLFNKLKLQVPKNQKQLKSQYYSTSDFVLSQIADMHPLPKLIIEYRSISKLLNTYIDPLLNFSQFNDNQIFCQWNQTNSANGRVTASSPNLQNLPRSITSLNFNSFFPILESKIDQNKSIALQNYVKELIRTNNYNQPISINLRSSFHTQDDNHWFVAFDYSQLEARILAHFCLDDDLLHFFRIGQDIHLHIAAKCFNKPSIESVTPFEREKAKTICYGILYGMGANTISQKLNISFNESTQLISSFLSKFPGIKKFRDTVVQNCKQNGYIETIFHKKRRINEPDPSVLSRIAFNAVIQGSAGDLVKTAMVNIDRKMTIDKLHFSSKLLLQIHDELIFECPTNEVERMKKLVINEMENVVKLEVPLPVCVKIGKNLGNLVYDDEILFDDYDLLI